MTSLSSPDRGTVFLQPLLNAKDAAVYLTISRRMLTNLIAQRRLKPARIGSRLVFKRADLDRYVDLLIAQAA